ncbi:MAG: beta-lactamase family protein [SAR202 cluster bacterium]|nr:beta-lactamase family protein [SAR202 cluster bacterium]
MPASVHSQNMDSRALERVRKVFDQQIDAGLHPGAALAVYWHGRLALDLQAGQANAKTDRPVQPDTMFVLYSATKPLAAICLHILWERGRLQWDDPVACHWPGFARNGKAGVTIRHILTHCGGFPETPEELTWDKWQDWEAIARALEEVAPIYEPGKVIAYHPRNFGWVIAELVRRIDGRTIDQFLREEVTGPLGMHDTYLGLPADLEDRVSRLHAMDDCDRPGMVHNYNRPQVHQAVQPSGGGIATARDLARFYAMLAAGGSLEGKRVLRPETVAEVTRLQVEGPDQTLEYYVRRGLGLSLEDPRTGGNGSVTVRTFGHAGAGTSIGWADPELGLAVAYITNGFRASRTNTPRLAVISQAVRDACR